MVMAILTCCAIVGAALNISGELRGPRRNIYIFKPLTMVFIILISIYAGIMHEQAGLYRWLILAGLICSIVGDIFLMLPSDKFVAGLVCFFFAHLFYITAFTAVFKSNNIFSFASFVPFIIYGAIMLMLLFPHLKEMKIPVMVYMAVILVMAWQALNRWLSPSPQGSLTAFIGALFFMSSDSLIAIDRFRGKFANAQFFIMSTYFIAQWLIAFSV